MLATSKHFDSNCILLTTVPIFEVQMPHCVLRKGQPLTTQVHHKAFLWHYIIQQTYKWNVKIMLNDEDTCNEIQMKRNLRELIQAAQKENELQEFICSFGRMDVYFTVMMLFNQH